MARWRLYTYWYPADRQFPNIDSIVKLDTESGKKKVAYLQITIAKSHSIDAQQLQRMNEIFVQDKEKEEAIYIAVLPNEESCKIFTVICNISVNF